MVSSDEYKFYSLSFISHRSRVDRRSRCLYIQIVFSDNLFNGALKCQLLLESLSGQRSKIAAQAPVTVQVVQQVMYLVLQSTVETRLQHTLRSQYQLNLVLIRLLAPRLAQQLLQLSIRLLQRLQLWHQMENFDLSGHETNVQVLDAFALVHWFVVDAVRLVRYFFNIGTVQRLHIGQDVVGLWRFSDVEDQIGGGFVFNDKVVAFV